MILDFSAHDTWDTCPAKWFERYCNKRVPKWPKAQRDDALCLGSLVHEGLRVWQAEHRVEIPQAVQDEVTPTLECLRLAEELVWGYTQHYPEERWPLVRCEEPVQFPLLEGGALCGNCGPVTAYKDGACYSCESNNLTWHEGLTGLAKIDSYFYVPEATEIETGIPGVLCTLSPGWWIHEYKTKSPYIPMGIYMQGWEMGMQASYQTLALQHHLRSRPEVIKHEEPTPFDSVQGILINVLEKPRRHVPQRTCKACKEKYEFYTWVPTGEGTYSCPVCGGRQVLTPLKEAQPQIPPAYYRFIVTRTPQELERDRRDIIAVGQRMLAMEAGGLYSEPWKHSSCVNTQWRRACEYFGPHHNFIPTKELSEFHEPADYRGLVQIEEVA